MGPANDDVVAKKEKGDAGADYFPAAGRMF